ncbi:MAG: hypothetical protein IKW62_05225 [Clostridia bacterium]|nr:hypothetical protein [Clostridia bacterium]
MDVFIEEIVRKKKTQGDFLLVLGVLLLGSLISAVLLAIVLPVFIKYGTFVLALVIAVIYGVYYVVTSVNVEYEYALVNAELDVDKIINKTRRKRLATPNIREIEDFGTKKEPGFGRYLKNSSITKVYACRDKKAEDIFFLVYNQGDTKMMLIFNPSAEIIDQIAKRNPQKRYI